MNIFEAKESARKSDAYAEVEKLMMGKLGTMPCEFNANDPKLCFFVERKSEDILNAFESDEMREILARLGWFLAEVWSDEDWGEDSVILEPMFAEVVPVPATLYHVTPTDRVDDIMEQGFEPRRGCKRTIHPARVYLALSEEGARRIESEFEASCHDTYAILEVDASSLRGIDFHADPYFDDGVYATCRIPAKALRPAQSPAPAAV